MSAMEIDNRLLVDPILIVNEELHDLIYQHFTGKEVMGLTVLKTWRKSIGVSPAAMKKIALVYDADTPRSKKDVTAILNSERHYSNVMLQNLKIPRRTTRNQQLQCNVVEKIAPWVKDLCVHNSRIGDIRLQFPNVERLILIGSNIKPILDGVTPNKLKTLWIDLHYKEAQPFKDFLMKCSKLKELRMVGFDLAHVFENEAAYLFKLKTFELSPNYESISIPNFGKFLLAQSSSLQRLILRYNNMEFVESALKLLPLLKELELHYLNASEALQLTVNPSVEILSLFYHNDSVQDLLTAIPNLKTLKLSNINSNTEINTIAATAMNLREVTYKYSDLNVEDHYKTFRQTNPNANQQIQWTINRD